MKSANSRHVTGTTPRADADRVNSPSPKILIPPSGFCKPIERVAPRTEVGAVCLDCRRRPGSGNKCRVRLEPRFRVDQRWIHPLTPIPDYILEFHEIALVRLTVAHGGRHDLDARGRPWFQMLDL